MSKDVEDIKDDIGKFIEHANQDLLKRGAPEDKGANVTGWSVKGDKISLNIVSEQFVRAHDALIRLKKGIGEELGKKHKIGARTATVDEYIITFTTEKDPVDDVTIPFVSEI
ncbi:MAG: serine--tRNA ligase, partial [Thermoplasmata archaeon]|nr:serine--tRNA ligase [Thermoplasmata archaeon]